MEKKIEHIKKLQQQLCPEKSILHIDMHRKVYINIEEAPPA